MQKIDISVIIPVYNNEKTIYRCIDSLINQSFDNFEVILVNDGSTDLSKDICNEYANNYFNISVVHKANGGVSSARNTGIKIANGEYIMFCDSDDYIEKNTLSRLYKQIKKEESDICISGAYWNFYDNNELYRTNICAYAENISDYTYNISKYYMYMFRTSSILIQSCWSKLYKKSIITNNNIYFNENMICYEDFEFNLRFLSKSKKFSYIKDILYYYNDSIISNPLKKRKKDNIVYEISKLYESWKEFMNNIPNNLDIKNFMNNIFIELYMLPLKKILLTNNMKYKSKIDILIDLENDIYFKKLNEEVNIRFFKILSILIKIRCYRLTLLIIKYKLQ